MTSKKMTIRFPQRLKSEMLSDLIKSGYGLRGKSRWLAEAIHLFLAQSNFVEFVEQGININQAELTDIEAFYLDTSTIQLLKNALFDVRVKYPLLEGVQSAFIRSAVIYKLMLTK